MTWESCAINCPFTGSPGDSCKSAGVAMDCDTFNEYGTCGDGYCALNIGEDTGNCAQDCTTAAGLDQLASPANESDPVLTPMLDAGVELENLGTGVEDVTAALGILYYYGLVDTDYSGYLAAPAPVPPTPTACAAALESDAELAELDSAACESEIVYDDCPPSWALSLALLSAILALGSVKYAIASAIVAAIGCPPCAGIATALYGASWIMYILAQVGASASAGTAAQCVMALYS